MKTRREALLKWLSQWEKMPPQGSAEWLSQRGGSCGGSELHRLQTGEREFVGQKCGLVTIPSILPMTWGTVFECVARDISEEIFSTDIYESASIPSIEHPLKTFSPDGIGIVELRARNSRGLSVRALLYVLFEYKTLWSRIPVPGVVYRDYIPQVKSGLADLGIPDIAIYIEQVIRLCSLRQLRTDDGSCNGIHYKPYTATVQPIATGCMIVYADSRTPQTDVWLTDPGFDFGETGTGVNIHDLLLAIKTGVLNATLAPISINYSRLRARSEFARAQCLDGKQARLLPGIREKVATLERSGRVVAGFLPFKVMDLNIVPVHKETGYTRRRSDVINAAMEKVFQLQKITNEAERWAAYNHMYGREDAGPADMDDYYV